MARNELARLRRVADEDNAAPARRYAAILDALNAGHSRRECAEALGITPEALRQFLQRRETNA